jgi:hypothetical protein
MIICQIVVHLLVIVKIIQDAWQKGEAIPLQAWTGPEVSRRLRLPDFKTFVT